MSQSQQTTVTDRRRATCRVSALATVQWSGFLGGIRRFLASEEGPTAVEYAVMLAFIITVCISAIASVGTHVNAYFVSAQNALT
jgi:pilus assembly protein Flp/PilA